MIFSGDIMKTIKLAQMKFNEDNAGVASNYTWGEGYEPSDIRALLPAPLVEHLQRLGIGSNGVPTAFHDAELYPALQLRADAGLRLILQLIKAGILEAADPNLQRLKLTAFGRAVVGKPTDSALDAYVGELQSTPLYSWNTSTGDATVTETPNADSVTYPLQNMPQPPTHFERVISELASEDSDFVERIRQALAPDSE